MIAKLEIYLIVFALLAAGAAGAYFYAKHEGVMEERGRWEAKAAAATKADLDSLTDAVKKGNDIATNTLSAVQQKKADRIIDRGVDRKSVV